MMIMPKTKRDELKRWCAQALNNSAKAILDANNVRVEFEKVHPEFLPPLDSFMIGLAAQREHLLAFVAAAWGLDEEQVMRYM